MPRGPKGEKRPADVIGNAVKVMKIAVGEEMEDLDNKEVKTSSDVGKMGADARAKKLSSADRKRIARNAALLRWAAKVK